MQYISTRGTAPALPFSDAMLTGLAIDGGLYLPTQWPKIDTGELSGASYQHIAYSVLLPFMDKDVSPADLSRLIDAAYAFFRDKAIVPLRQWDERLWLMELFHGPTYAFKDIALQLLGDLYDHVLARRKEAVTVIGATSGDTGSAAIEACRDKERITVFMLHPKGRISDIQRKQMTHVQSPNVFNIAIEGSFDDCQELVKALFAQENLRKEYRLAAVNSINWARIAAQICYYFAGTAFLGNKQTAFAVPSGNFGNIYSGYAARQMGAPIERLIIGTNSNDALVRVFNEGTLTLKSAQETYSPSMDVQIPSNLERLLFDLYDRDGLRLNKDLVRLPESGTLSIPEAGKAAPLFSAYAFDDDRTLEAMRSFYKRTGWVIDPHTAIGAAAALADKEKHDLPVIALATAHPAKFPKVVEKALGFIPEIPESLGKILDLPERYVTFSKDVKCLREYIAAHAKRGNS